MNELLIDRLRCMDALKLLTCRLLHRIILSWGRAGHSEREHYPVRKIDSAVQHLRRPPETILDAIRAGTLVKTDQ
jgi:hypothetical protein